MARVKTYSRLRLCAWIWPRVNARWSSIDRLPYRRWSRCSCWSLTRCSVLVSVLVLAKARSNRRDLLLVRTCVRGTEGIRGGLCSRNKVYVWQLGIEMLLYTYTKQFHKPQSTNNYPLYSPGKRMLSKAAHWPYIRSRWTRNSLHVIRRGHRPGSMH